MGLIAEVADFTRFDDPYEYCSYLGLCPWEDSSGDTIKTEGVQPRCNSHLRPFLVEASWQAIRRSRNLFAYYSKHTGKSGKKPIIKVVCKLALIAKGVATTRQLYQEDYLKEKRREHHPDSYRDKKELTAGRFSSGITDQHMNEQPDNRLQITAMPG